MNVEDHDWLDQRLAGGKYLPDDGFTARVVGRLSTARAHEAARRRRILAMAAFLAAALVIVQIVPLAREFQHLMAGQSFATLFAALGAHAHQWTFQAGVAVVMTLVALGSLSLLRRWS